MVNRDFIHHRQEYGKHTLVVEDMMDHPVSQFKKWYKQAEASGVKEPNTMTLASVDSHGQPTIRVVLLKEITDEGLVFYTNFNSRKGKELAQHPKAGVNFYWQLIEQQVRFDGSITKISAEKADKYFSTRPRGSQLGAWVSAQSELIPSRQYLEQELERFTTQFEGQDIPRPPHWGGYLLTPTRVEFWQGGKDRLHDRILYTAKKRAWARCRLAP